MPFWLKKNVICFSSEIHLLHIVGWLITGLYYNNLDVLAQVVSLVFCEKKARSKLANHDSVTDPNEITTPTNI